jgi:hypothetical protein
MLERADPSHELSKDDDYSLKGQTALAKKYTTFWKSLGFDAHYMSHGLAGNS